MKEKEWVNKAFKKVNIYGLIVSQAGFIYNNMPNALEEGKLWNQTICTPINLHPVCSGCVR